MQTKHFYMVEKLDSSKYPALATELKKIKGVVSLEIDERGNLCYTVDEWTDEYDVMISVMNKITDEGGELGFIDEHPQAENEAETVEETEDGEDNYSQAESGQKEDKQENKDKKGKKDKKPITESMQRAIELCFALALFVVYAFVDHGGNFANVLLLLAFAVSGYEILYDAICEIANKNILNTHLLVALSALISLFVGQTLVGALTAFIYSAAYVVCKLFGEKYSFKETLGEKYKNAVCYALVDGKEKRTPAVGVAVNDEVVLHRDETAYFDCKIRQGDAKVERVKNGKTEYVTIKKGDSIYCGEKIYDGDVTVIVTKLFADTNKGKENNIGEIKGVKKEKKLNLIFNIIVLVTGLLITFILPIFDEYGYAYGLTLSAAKGAAVIALAGINYLTDCFKDVMFNAYVCLKTNSIEIKNLDVIEKTAKAKSIVFDKNGTLTSGNYKAEEKVYVKEYKGKLIELLQSVSDDALHENYPLNKGDITVGYFADFEDKPPVIEREGIKIYIKKAGEFIGAVIYKEEVFPDSVGACRELRDLGVEKEYLLSSESKEYTSYLRTKFGMYNSFGQLDDAKKAEKLQAIKDEADGTVIYVGNAGKQGDFVTVSMGNGAADIVVKNSEISYLPMAVKVSERARFWRKTCLIAVSALKVLSLAAIFFLNMDAAITISIASAGMLLCMLAGVFVRKTA